MASLLFKHSKPTPTSPAASSGLCTLCSLPGTLLSPRRSNESFPPFHSDLITGAFRDQATLPPSQRSLSLSCASFFILLVTRKYTCIVSLLRNFILFPVIYPVPKLVGTQKIFIE